MTTTKTEYRIYNTKTRKYYLRSTSVSVYWNTIGKKWDSIEDMKDVLLKLTRQYEHIKVRSNVNEQYKRLLESTFDLENWIIEKKTTIIDPIDILNTMLDIKQKAIIHDKINSDVINILV